MAVRKPQAENHTTAMLESMREARADYNAAKPSRFRRKRTGVASQGSGADYHYRVESDYFGIIEQARDAERNDSLLGRIVDSAVINTIQSGFKLDPQTGDEALDMELWERFDEWASDPDACDIAGEYCFHDFECLNLRRVMFDGDIVILPLQSGELQVIEAHRVRTPHKAKDIIHGVKLDSFRKRVQYWITKDDIDPLGSVTAKSEIYPHATRDALGNRQVLHIYDPKRSTQTRGVSALAPIIDPAAMRDDIEFATMVKQQVASCFAIIRTRAMGFDGNNDPAGMGYGYTQQQGGGYSRQVGGIAPGMEVLGEPGETINGFSPNVPNPEYFQQISGLVRLIAANLGCPPEVSLFDTTQTTFHGYRGAVDEARRGFRRNQEWLKKRFHMPVYRWKVRQWMSEDAALRSRYAALGEKLFNHKWNSPNWAYIDPVKDAAGDKDQLNNGLISPRRWANGRGYDIDELNDEIVADNISRIRKAQDAANEFNEDYPDYPITWRDVLKPYEGEIVYTGKANLNEIRNPQSPAAPTTPQEQDDPEDDDQGAEDDE
jgi:lambda family phage portal protein